MKSIDELGDDLCDYCPLEDELKGTKATGNGYYSCEGRCCDEAYNEYLKI